MLYDPSGKAKSGWTEIDELRIDYRELILAKGTSEDRSYIKGNFRFDEPLNERVVDQQPYDGPGDYINGPFFDTFGGGCAIIMRGVKGLHYAGEYAVWLEGAFTSEMYGLTMEFHDGKPITLEVKASETTEVEIMAMVTDW